MMHAVFADRCHLQPFVHMAPPHPAEAAPARCTVFCTSSSLVHTLTARAEKLSDLSSTHLSSCDYSRLVARTATENSIPNPNNCALYPSNWLNMQIQFLISITCDKSREASILAAPGGAVPPPVIDAPGTPRFTPRFTLGVTPHLLNAPGFP